MDVIVAEHISSASSYKDGEVIFRLILPAVIAGERVVVDLAGFTSVPSAFVNSAFIQLLEHVPFDQVRNTLTFVHSTRQINQLIRSRFAFVVQSQADGRLADNDES